MAQLDDVANYAERIVLGKDGKLYILAYDIYDFGPEYYTYGSKSEAKKGIKYKEELARAEGSVLQKIPNLKKGEGQVGIIVNKEIVGYENLQEELQKRENLNY